MKNFNDFASKYSQNYLFWNDLKSIIHKNQSPVKKTLILIENSFTA